MKKLSVLIVSALAMFPVSVFAQADSNIMPAVPEPTSLILIITGLAGVLGLRKIFKK
jgi:hypothetical protein